MAIKSGHVIAAVIIVGLVIYLFTKTKVSGTVTADSDNATITSSPGINSSTSHGSVSYGTELGDS